MQNASGVVWRIRFCGCKTIVEVARPLSSRALELAIGQACNFEVATILGAKQPRNFLAWPGHLRLTSQSGASANDPGAWG